MKRPKGDRIKCKQRDGHLWVLTDDMVGKYPPNHPYYAGQTVERHQMIEKCNYCWANKVTIIEREIF